MRWPFERVSRSWTQVPLANWWRMAPDGAASHGSTVSLGRNGEGVIKEVDDMIEAEVVKTGELV